MALTGQLSDMSLAELIEFFCNQRKTGRLKIDYQRGHSVFFIREGELVDAKVGSLSGVDAVYFSLTLPNAAFDFSPDVQATRRTINEKWTQVVLEGLRRLDEGLAPTEVDAFGGFSPTEADLAQMFDQVEHLDDGSKPRKNSSKNGAALKNGDAKGSDANGAGVKSQDADVSSASAGSAEASSAEPFSMMVESASGGGSSKKKFVVMAVAAAVLLACAAVAVPFVKRSGAGNAAPAAAVAPQPASTAAPEPSTADASGAAPDAAAAEGNAETPDASAGASEAARREALDRERRERERRRKEDAAKKNSEDSAEGPANDSAAAKPLAPAPSGPKSVRVTINYDEAGRVTQASVAGATPGAEAYGSTAVRIARGRRFPAGKAGSTVVTIPVN